MATSFSCLTPTPIIPSAFSNHRNTQAGRRGTSVSVSSNSWWTPLFGWSSDPDYIHAPTNGSVVEDQESADSASGKQIKSRFQLGCFTEEKAKQLRLKTMETANFHDIMYHSAIASRLASDISRRGDS